MTMIVLYVSFLAVFNLIHPGIRLAPNLPIVIIAISALMLSLPPLLMIYNEGFSFLKEIRRKIVGVHFAEIGRISAILLAFSTGIMSMKRRKARTILTLLSIVLVIYSLILFTSTSFYTIVRAKESSGENTLWRNIDKKQRLVYSSFRRFAGDTWVTVWERCNNKFEGVDVSACKCSSLWISQAPNFEFFYRSRLSVRLNTRRGLHNRS